MPRVPVRHSVSRAGPAAPAADAAEQERISPDWAAAQRREERRLNRPLRAAFVTALAVAVLAVSFGVVGWVSSLLAGLGVIAGVLVAAVSGYALGRGARALRTRLADERGRVGRLRDAQESQLFAWQAAHAARIREWQAQRIAYEHQKRWYAV